MYFCRLTLLIVPFLALLFPITAEASVSCGAYRYEAFRKAQADVIASRQPGELRVFDCFMSKEDAAAVRAAVAAEEFNEAYRLLITAEPNADLLHAYLEQEMIAQIVRRFVNEPERQGRTIGWAWGRLADAAVEYFAHTGDMRIPSLLLPQCAMLLSYTDRALGRVDEITGDLEPSWGGYERVIEGQNEPRAYTREITSAGVTFSPCVRVAALLKQNPEHAELYAPFIKQIIDHGAEVYDSILELAIERPETNSISFISGVETWHEAINHTGVWGEFVAWMYLATGEDRYRDHFRGVLNFMELCAIELPDGRFFTEYRPTYEQCLAYRDRDDLATIKGEHTFKARQTIILPVRAREIGLQPNEQIAVGLSRSFKEHSFKKDGEWCIRLNEGCGENPKQQRLYSAPGWMLLDEFDPSIRPFIVDLVAGDSEEFRNGWFTNRDTVRAYARRFKVIDEQHRTDVSPTPPAADEPAADADVETDDEALIDTDTRTASTTEDDDELARLRLEKDAGGFMGDIIANYLDPEELATLEGIVSAADPKSVEAEIRQLREEIFEAALNDEVRRITEGLSTDREKALAIAGWLGRHMHHISQFPLAEAGGKGSRWANYAYRVAACGGRAGIYIRMAEIAKIKAKRFTLYNLNRPGGGHTVVQVLIDGKWSFIDSTYGAYFEAEDGSLMSWEDIVARPPEALKGLKAVDDAPQFRSGRPENMSTWKTVMNSDHVRLLYNEQSLGPATNAGYVGGDEPIVLTARIDATALPIEVGALDASNNDVRRDGVRQRITEQLDNWGRIQTPFHHSFTFANLEPGSSVSIEVVPSRIEGKEGAFKVSSTGCRIDTDELSRSPKDMVVGEPLVVTATADALDCTILVAHDFPERRTGMFVDQVRFAVD